MARLMIIVFVPSIVYCLFFKGSRVNHHSLCNHFEEDKGGRRCFHFLEIQTSVTFFENSFENTVGNLCKV